MKLPIKPTFKSEFLPLLLIIIAVAFGFYGYSHWPNTVASHWNFQGQVDGYSSKAFMALFFPLLFIGFYVLFLVLPCLDPKKERYPEFAGVYNIFRNLLLLVLAITYLASGIYNLGYRFNVGYVVGPAVGLLMIVLGNYMSKIRFNWFVGIRTPWTMSSETVWNKTHRVGSWLFMLFGLVIAVSPFLPPPIAAGSFFTAIILLLIFTFGYSFWLYQKEKKQK